MSRDVYQLVILPVQMVERGDREAIDRARVFVDALCHCSFVMRLWVHLRVKSFEF